MLRCTGSVDADMGFLRTIDASRVESGLGFAAGSFGGVFHTPVGADGRTQIRRAGLAGGTGADGNGDVGVTVSAAP